MNIVIRFLFVCLLAFMGAATVRAQDVIFEDGMDYAVDFRVIANTPATAPQVLMGATNVFQYGYTIVNNSNLEVRTLKLRVMIVPLTNGVSMPFQNVRFQDDTLGQRTFGVSCGTGCWDFDYPGTQTFLTPPVVQSGQSYQLALLYNVGLSQNFGSAANQTFAVTVVSASSNQDGQPLPLHVVYTGNPFFITLR